MKKKILSILLAVMIILSAIPFTAVSVSAADVYNGTPVTPQKITSSNYQKFGLTSSGWSAYNGYYGIRTAAELYGFAELVNGSAGASINGVLLSDIVVNETVSENGAEYEWTPIGCRDNQFIGTFDGNGHSVSGLYCDINADFIGLFGLVGTASADPKISTVNIKNVVLKNSFIFGTRHVGGIVGAAWGNQVTVSSCKVEETVTICATDSGRDSCVGGIVGGYIDSSMFITRVNQVTNCVNMGRVKTDNGEYNIGAVVGNYRHPDNAKEYIEVSGCYYLEGCATDCSDTPEKGKGCMINQSDKGCTVLSGANASHDCNSISVTHKEEKATCENIGLGGCSEYSYCLVCGKVTSGTKTVYEVTDHEYSDATCVTLATCIYCGITTGATNGSNHEGQIKKYVSADEQYHYGVYGCCGAHTENRSHNYADATCLAVQTCTDCGAVTGDKDPSNHTGTEKIYEVSPTDRSKHDYKWKCCGLVIESAKHNYENSHCTICDHYCEHLKTESGSCLDCGKVGVGYVNRYWDSQANSVVSEMAFVLEPEIVTDSTSKLSSGWYVVESDVSISGRVTVSGTVNLILADGCTLKMNKTLNVPADSELNIYGQLFDTGNLSVIIEDSQYAGIGGANGACGKITINGGTITAIGGNGAGIGGSEDYSGGTITINGGTVTATGGNSGAGIGGGQFGSGGTVTINGGTITAVGGSGGAGIGGGYGGSGGTITINGGDVTATGGDLYGAGIGGGFNGSGGNITISGGTVTAIGAESSSSSGFGGAGIGGGQKGEGGSVIIKGGNVKAFSKHASQIGAGIGNTNNGTLTDGNGNVVSLKTFILDGVTEGAYVTSVSGMNGYGVRDVFALDGDKLYFYLPSAPDAAAVTANGEEYVFVCDRNDVFYTYHDASLEYKYTVNGEDAEKHDTRYACCNLIIETSLHDYVGEATCLTSAVCSLCKAKKLDENNHESDEFKYNVNAEDALKHDVWHSCCNVFVETVSHTYTNGVCVSCGYICNHTEMQNGKCITCGSSGNYYINCVWDAEKGAVVSELLEFTPDHSVDATVTEWSSGWYVLASDVTFSKTINVTGDVHLVLSDGCTLTLDVGIRVLEGNSLTIYGQSDGSGKLIATTASAYAAIGGHGAAGAGSITINGGIVTAIAEGNASGSGAGIGGGNWNAGGTVTINGGTVIASSTKGGGIGAGAWNSEGTVIINGGNVKASSVKASSVTDGNGNAVSLQTFSLDGVAGQVPVTKVSGAEGYGLKGVYTLDDNKLYFYLSSQTPTAVTAGGVDYICKRNSTFYSSHDILEAATCLRDEFCSACGLTVIDKENHEKDTITNGFRDCCGEYQPAELVGDVYEISNAGQLYWLAQQIPQMSDEFHAKLTADITFPEDIPWTTVGVPENISTDSILDGDGHTLNIGSQSGGLFSSFNYGIIKNMIVRGSITADGGNVGALAGSAYRTQFQNIISYVDVTNETGNAGGLVGYYGGKHADGRYSRIENCAVYADITGNNAGGLVGEGWNGTQYYDITNSVYVGDVTGSSAAGAIVGYQNTDSNTSRFTNIYWCETDGLDFYGKRDTTNQVYTQTEAKTVEQFASGEVAYLLGEAFGQTIGSDEYPLLGGDTVYQVLNCKGETAYSNANETLGHNYSDGVCTVCGEKQILRGDVNGDGRINSRDAMSLKKYIGNAGGTINIDNADVNEDGRINSRDLMSLKKKLTN